MGQHADHSEGRSAHDGKGAEPAIATRPTAISIPRDFTLCRESELPAHTDLGREALSESRDEMYGVESLEDVLESATLPSMISTDSGLDPDKRRRPGNPVHPNIMATGQRIISSETKTPKSPHLLQAAPIIAKVPSFQDRLRAISGFTSPREPSPSSVSELPQDSTHPSGSPLSLRLSDDESLKFDDNASQVILSASSDEEGEHGKSTGDDRRDPSPAPSTHLVMPSLSLPARRPFTARGSQMGHMNILVAGRRGAGKSELIQNILNQSPDIVHFNTPRIFANPHCAVTETVASTKSVPKWKRKSISKSEPTSPSASASVALERNLVMMECDVSEDESCVDKNTTSASGLLNFVRSQSAAALAIDDMDNSQLTALMAGEGTLHVDVVLYLLKDTPSATEADLINKLSAFTNVVPVLAAGQSTADQMTVESELNINGARCISITRSDESLSISNQPRCIRTPTQTGSPSVVWSSDSPCQPDSIESFLDDLFHPPTMRALRHSAITKLVKSRHTLPRHALLPSPALPPNTPNPAASSASLTCSTISTPSAVLVPHPDSSFYHSPSLSAHTVDSTSRIPSHLQLALLHPPEPEQPEVRIAQWALDLHRSLHASPLPLQEHRALACRKSRPSPRRRALVPPQDPLRIVALLSDPLPFCLRLAGVGAALATVAVLGVRCAAALRAWWAPAEVQPLAPMGAGLPDFTAVFGGPQPVEGLWDAVVGQVREWLY